LTVQHVRIAVDPTRVRQLKCASAQQLEIATDGVHANDKQVRIKNTKEYLSVRKILFKEKTLLIGYTGTRESLESQAVGGSD